MMVSSGRVGGVVDRCGWRLARLVVWGWCLPEVKVSGGRCQAPRPGDLRKGFGSLKVRRMAHGSEDAPHPSLFRIVRRGTCAGRPACELALAPLRPRQIGIVQTLVWAGTDMRFGF